MRTTLTLSDDLTQRAKVIQKQNGITFKAMVEEGLRLAIARRTTAKAYRFEPVFGGSGWLTEDAERAGGLSAVVREINER